MIVLDSCGWVEIFTQGPNWAEFKRRVEEADRVLVPAVVLYEVYKIMRRELPVHLADEIAGELRSHTILPLSDRLAVEAAEYSLQHRLAMGDAMVYATARAHEATVVTCDADLSGLPGVDYLASVKE